MKYSEIIDLIASTIVTRFDEVYHSAEIITNDKKEKEPVATLGNEWISLAPTDQKETIYIRRSGDDEVLEELAVGSCSKSYKMRTPLRIVFFRDRTADHAKIIRDLAQSVLINKTKLKAIIRDKWRLQKDESSGDYSFGPDTAYFAIEIYAMWDLVPNTCDEDFCVDIPNPLKKESCPAVA